VIDTKPNPRRPKIIKVIEPDELHERTGYSCPDAVHCGPEGIYVGAQDGNGPGGVFVMDHDSFEPLGRWEVERGPQYFAYDFWWHLGHDTMITSEWGTGWSRCNHARHQERLESGSLQRARFLSWGAWSEGKTSER
jgi:selenium-binding protein 1